MAQILQHRRDTTTALQNERGSVGEIIIDTTKTTVVVMDGVTNGGTPLAKESDIPTDVSQLTDTQGLLGGGGTVDPVDPVDPNIWIQTFSSDQPTTDFVQAATSVEYDVDGNIIALFNHVVPNDDYNTYTSVAKFTPTGIIMWKVRLGSNLNTDGWGLAYDFVNNYVYIAGRTSGAPLTYEFATLTKLNGGNGFSEWSKTYDFEANSSSAVVDVDGNGDPVMVGYGYNGSDNYIATTKINKTDGSVVWSKSINGQGDDQAYGMAIGPANEVVTIGYINEFNSVDTDDRMIVIKYAANGTIAWQQAVQFEVGYNCSGADADIDSLGNIYVCGQYSYSKNGGVDSAMSLVKFNSAGVKQWSRRVVGNCETFGTSVVVGDDGFLYLTGITGNDNTSDYTWVIAKYNTNGVVVWQNLIDNVSNWTFSGSFWFGSSGGGSNIAVRNGYIALSGAFGNPFNNSQATAVVLQIDTNATSFSAGNWNIIPATFSGLLNSTASDITVVDAAKMEGDNSPNAVDFVLNSDFSNFLTGTLVGAASSNSIDNGEYSLTLNSDGSFALPTLTVPISDNTTPNGTGQTFKFSDPTKQAIIFGPESTTGFNSAERIIIQGAPGYAGTAGEGGDVYVWAGPGGNADGQGGDIKVRAGRGFGTGNGGYLNFQAGDTNTGYGGYINIESGETGTANQGGYIDIRARNGGDINLYANQSGTINFNTDGNMLTLGGVTPQVGSSLVIETGAGYADTALAIASDPTLATTYPAGSTITFQDGEVRTITSYDNYPGGTDIFWDTAKTGTLFPITLKTADFAPVVPVTTSITVVDKQWTFNENGWLTTPNNGVIQADTLIALSSFNANNSIARVMCQSIADSSRINLRTTTSSGGQKDWLFNSNGFLTMPGGGSLNITTPPTSSDGAVGDKAGMIAFDSSAIYYCVTNYGGYTVSLIGGYTGTYPSILQGDYPKPLIGWTIMFDGYPFVLLEDATSPNPGEWLLHVDQSITTDNVSVQLQPSPNIWVKQAWSTTGTW